MGRVRGGLAGLNRFARLFSVGCGVALVSALAVTSPVFASGRAVSISPPSFNYGTVGVGNQSAAQTFVLTNTGTPDLHIWGVTLGGTNPSDFRIYLSGCDYHAVFSGATCTEGVVFAPKEAPPPRPDPTFLSDATVSPRSRPRGVTRQRPRHIDAAAQP